MLQNQFVFEDHSSINFITVIQQLIQFTLRIRTQKNLELRNSFIDPEFYNYI